MSPEWIEHLLTEVPEATAKRVYIAFVATTLGLGPGGTDYTEDNLVVTARALWEGIKRESQDRS